METDLSLESFIDKSIRLSENKGYRPTIFIGMRERYGTIETISRLVISGDIQSGFTRLEKLALLDWSIENAVLEYKEKFSEKVLEAARWRLEQARK